VCDSSLGIDGWLAIDYCTRTSSESLLCIPGSLEKTKFASWEILHTASGVRLFWNLLILRLSRAISSSFSGAKSQSSHSIDLSLVFASLLSPEAKRLDSKCFFFHLVCKVSSNQGSSQLGALNLPSVAFCNWQGISHTLHQTISKGFRRFYTWRIRWVSWYPWLSLSWVENKRYSPWRILSQVKLFLEIIQ